LYGLKAPHVLDVVPLVVAASWVLLKLLRRRRAAA
jgi:hypothetical protein